uniref:Uncharacterized protein n=1 Tax=Gossypium raimondii TaxID=29730 RepID=A0A0D2TS53_GOSRA|nr:hypothetical protein B456_009G263000 [Gossypium raimondii]
MCWMIMTMMMRSGSRRHKVVGFSYVSFFLIFKSDALHYLFRVKGNVWGMPELGQKKLKYGPDMVLIYFYA